VISVFKKFLKAAGKDAYSLHFERGIPINRAKMIYADSDDPWRGEVKLVDEFCKANGALVMKYCATRCPEGRYLGLEYPEITIQSAGLQIISILGQAESLIPRVAELALRYASDGKVGPEYRELCSQLSSLRHCIQAIELQLRGESLPRSAAAVSGLRAYIKEKSTCAVGAAQVATV
jgi:hypothetical protein